MSNPTRSKRSGLNDRTVRSLTSLDANASTSRTLNLIAAWAKHSQSLDYQRSPFFQNPMLNKSIIVKHRLRPNERDLFLDGRSAGTKVILPIDVTNLQAGGQSFFVEQVGYRDILNELLGATPDALQHDEGVLAALNALPSLDPFLLRERLKREGFTPDRCYFEITDADAARMFQFARNEISPLIGMAFDGASDLHADKISKLAVKILENTGGEELEPLRAGLGMSKPEFAEGIFCWKGFIYYKWLLMDLLPKIQPMAAEISAVKVIGSASMDERAYIQSTGARIGKLIIKACSAVRATLKVYDDAYVGMTRNKEPKMFREFLLEAPTLFQDLGERLGNVQHVVSFWRFRFPVGGAPKAPAEELVDMFADFEANFEVESADAATAAWGG
jgi:hypothetical protein